MKRSTSIRLIALGSLPLALAACDSDRSATRVVSEVKRYQDVDSCALAGYLWLEQQMQRGVLPADADQFNSLEEKLGQVFGANTFATPFYFASVRDSLEDRGTVQYLCDIATAAGLDTRLIDVEDIGLNPAGRFIDRSGAPIPSLFKLYPWEDMFHDRYGPAIAGSGTLFVEPPWKALLSNKGMLALLWEQHEGHPNLLPAFIDATPERPLAPGW
uniref:GSP_synth domain-containing protein n=1 Tax=Steinernema glaseri TaxID=37863 RepID=A0A1I8AU62_9BILA